MKFLNNIPPPRKPGSTNNIFVIRNENRFGRNYFKLGIQGFTTATSFRISVSAASCSVNMSGAKMKCLDVVRTNLLVILTMVGVAFGFVVGFVAREYNPSASALMWIGKYIYF